MFRFAVTQLAPKKPVSSKKLVAAVSSRGSGAARNKAGGQARTKSPASKAVSPLKAKKIGAADRTTTLSIRNKHHGAKIVGAVAGHCSGASSSSREEVPNPALREAARQEEEEHLWATWSDDAAERFVRNKQQQRLHGAQAGSGRGGGGCASTATTTATSGVDVGNSSALPTAASLLDPAAIKELAAEPVVFFHR